VPTVAALHKRIRELEATLAHTRAVAVRDRRRAELLERAAAEAYRRAAHVRVPPVAE
jgi:hypothetical protein